MPRLLVMLRRFPDPTFAAGSIAVVAAAVLAAAFAGSVSPGRTGAAAVRHAAAPANGAVLAAGRRAVALPPIVPAGATAPAGPAPTAAPSGRTAPTGPTYQPGGGPMVEPDMPPTGLLFEVPGWQHLTGAPTVALTFDDGPDPVFTAAILDILASRKATATFFMVGSRAARHPELVDEALRLGNTVGGHTWSHVRLPRLSDGRFAAEVDATNDLLAAHVGHPLRCVRPPYGRFDPQVVQRISDRRMVTMMWNVDPRDWTKPGPEAIDRRVVAGLRPGAVILLHDAGGDRSQTVAALPAILDAIAAAGYRTVPLC